jgi:Zn-dependent protease
MPASCRRGVAARLPEDLPQPARMRYIGLTARMKEYTRMPDDPLSPEVVAARVVGRRPGGLRTKLGGLAAAALVVFAKLKTILLLLLNLKFVLTVVSALASVFVYGLAFGWPFGVGFVALLAIHEFGHWVAIRREGLPAGLPVFIPFLGAAITLRQQPLDAWQEFKIAAAGPAFGTVASAAALAIGLFAASPHAAGLYLSLAYIGFFLQLFNLIPVAPLDGGRILAAVSPRLWWLGLPILIGAAIWLRSVFTGIIALLVVLQLFARWRGRKAAAAAGYYSVPPLQRTLAGLTWLLLVLLCVAGMGVVGAV